MRVVMLRDEFFYKHHDKCGNIRNHILIEDIVVIGENRMEGWDDPYSYQCDVYMTWKDGDGTVYMYPDAELEDPDDEDAAIDHVVESLG